MGGTVAEVVEPADPAGFGARANAVLTSNRVACRRALVQSTASPRVIPAMRARTPVPCRLSRIAADHLHGRSTGSRLATDIRRAELDVRNLAFVPSRCG